METKFISRADAINALKRHLELVPKGEFVEISGISRMLNVSYNRSHRMLKIFENKQYLKYDKDTNTYMRI